MQVISNARIVNEGHQWDGYVVIGDDGRIAEVGEGRAPQSLAGTIVDARGMLLMPGAIDMHVHTRDPGLTHKASMASESLAALHGGVTSICDMPNTIPPTTSLKAWQAKMDHAAADAKVNYAFWLGATSINLDELNKADYNLTPGVKIFMGSSTGGLLVSEASLQDKIFADLDRRAHIAVHAEDNEIIAKATQLIKERYPQRPVPITLHDFIRPIDACVVACRRAAKMALRYRRHLHIAHISTAAELALLASYRPYVTAEACVGHLWWCNEDYQRLGSRIKCNPSIKSATDRQALRQGVIDGSINTIATDHAPHLLNEKIDGALKAPSGFPSIQYSVPMMLTLFEDPMLVVEKMCHAPARIFGIRDRGYIRQGYWADLTLVDTSLPARVSDYDVISKCGWTPLAGETLQARVMHTWVNGDTKPQPLQFMHP